MKFLPKPKNKKKIYLDHAAATYVLPEVLQAMNPFWNKFYANPSGLFKSAQDVRAFVGNARKKIATIIGAQESEIIFTSGGTEGDNLAIFGTALANEKKGKHIISTRIEHSAVLRPLEELEKKGFEVTYINVDKFGSVNADDIYKHIRKDTILVSIMYANNEIGTIEPISEIGKKIIHWRKNNKTELPYFHTDACQAAQYLPMLVNNLHVDLMTINGSKMYAPKGTGFLYKRKNVNILPKIIGGYQEFGLRAGTENVPGIIGLTKAFEIAQSNLEKESKKVGSIRDELWNRIKKAIPSAKLNGHPVSRLPNNLNFSISAMDAETLIMYLDGYGIMAGTGSACSNEKKGPSHVLTAIGNNSKQINGSIRFSLGKINSKKDIEYIVKYLKNIVSCLM